MFENRPVPPYGKQEWYQGDKVFTWQYIGSGESAHAYKLRCETIDPFNGKRTEIVPFTDNSGEPITPVKKIEHTGIATNVSLYTLGVISTLDLSLAPPGREELFKLEARQLDRAVKKGLRTANVYEHPFLEQILTEEERKKAHLFLTYIPNQGSYEDIVNVGKDQNYPDMWRMFGYELGKWHVADEPHYDPALKNVLLTREGTQLFDRGFVTTEKLLGTMHFKGRDLSLVLSEMIKRSKQYREKPYEKPKNFKEKIRRFFEGRNTTGVVDHITPEVKLAVEDFLEGYHEAHQEFAEDERKAEWITCLERSRKIFFGKNLCNIARNATVDERKYIKFELIARHRELHDYVISPWIEKKLQQEETENLQLAYAAIREA